MGADTDFNALYRELGVDADCDIEQFRRAYRRRVGSLHPDHRGTDDGLARLQQLTQSYTRAVEFHRLHRRLPGSATARNDPARARYKSAQDPAGHRPPAVAGKPHRARYSILVALVGMLLLWLHETNSAGPVVVVGMDAVDVRAVQGEPSIVSEPRWEYGPSWIEFRCDRVVDWYSAPGYPLRVEGDATLGANPVSLEPAFDC